MWSLPSALGGTEWRAIVAGIISDRRASLRLHTRLAHLAAANALLIAPLCRSPDLASCASESGISEQCCLVLSRIRPRRYRQRPNAGCRSGFLREHNHFACMAKELLLVNMYQIISLLSTHELKSEDYRRLRS